MRRLILSLLFMPALALGQGSLVDSLISREKASKKRVLQYAAQHSVGIKTIFPNGKVVELTDVDPFGRPVYFTTHNSEAAFTTSTSSLYSGSILGLNLSGAGMTAGVWDGGAVLGNHVELIGKTVQKDNPGSLSSHSTHVTGTIAARGINPLARGMASKAFVNNYDWNSVDSEMQTEASGGLLISNHSWGFVTGWEQNPSNGGWTWNGDPAVSNLEDYRFGLYTSNSASWDLITYNNPNFLIVKSAGNDRNDSGATGHPPDGPFDTIDPLGVSKNILTIGAVGTLSAKYASPNDVLMSSFSSWGPTDDGRIKPDLVGDGVNIFSTWSDNATSYSSISGTSMAAPNVTGSLILLQELYKKLYAKYMRSATLKGLAIATAEEAGNLDGPDYQFGWGLLNMERAARLLLAENGADFQVIESRINAGATYQKQIVLKQGQKINATICWTDRPGVGEGRLILDPVELRLVNDLDMRITQNGPGTVFSPWTIDPATKIVSKGDNFRDNVEQIEFTAPADGLYTLTIGHKGQLQTGVQDFSLIFYAGNIDSQLPVLYFRGASNNWNDTNNWATTSGGVSANRIPTSSDIVVFDDSATSSSVNLASNAYCFSLTFVGTKATAVDLNNFSLALGGSLLSENPQLVVKNGSLEFSNTGNSCFIETQGTFTNLAFAFTGTGSYTLNSDLKIPSMTINSGGFDSNGKLLDVAQIVFGSTASKNVDLSDSMIKTLEMILTGTNLSLTSTGTRITFSGLTGLLKTPGHFKEIIFATNDGRIESAIRVEKLTVTDDFLLTEDSQVDTLFISKARSLTIAGTKTLTVASQLYFTPLITGFTTIKAVNASGVGMIQGVATKKICLPQMTIQDIDLTGPYKLIVPVSSTITNSKGWIAAACGDVLFADFTAKYTCKGGVADFVDRSDGNPTNWVWDFGNGAIVTGVSTAQHTFLQEGTFEVKLTVLKNAESHTTSQMIVVTKSNLNKPSVIVREGVLWSTTFADFYLWYRNDISIPNATTYTLSDFGIQGAYTIEIYNTSCKLRSNPYVVTALDEQPPASVSNLLLVYPNPASNILQVQSGILVLETMIVDALGRSALINFESIGENQYRLDVSGIPTGLYVLRVITNSGTSVKKVIIRR
ncbi:hypothetical protein BH09BAC3_BH09BAC3_31060 [soil metagenome]